METRQISSPQHARRTRNGPKAGVRAPINRRRGSTARPALLLLTRPSRRGAGSDFGLRIFASIHVSLDRVEAHTGRPFSILPLTLPRSIDLIDRLSEHQHHGHACRCCRVGWSPQKTSLGFGGEGGPSTTPRSEPPPPGTDTMIDPGAKQKKKRRVDLKIVIVTNAARTLHDTSSFLY